MIDFKILVRVDPEDPKKTLTILGQKVCGNAGAFETIDPIWAKKQDYLTAVPVEIALTVEMREVLQTHTPDARFVVTGVKTANVDNLVNMYGYKVFAPILENAVASEVRENKEENKNILQTAGTDIDPVKHEVSYWINGKKVSQQEYDEKLLKLNGQIKEVFGNLSDFFSF